MSKNVNRLNYHAHIREAEDLEKLATSAFVNEALLEMAADYRRAAEAELRDAEKPSQEKEGSELG